MSCGLHHAHNVYTKRDLNSRLRPAALGHAELLGKVYTSLFHCYSELPVVHNSTRAQSRGLWHGGRVEQGSAPTIKSAREL